MVQGWVSIDIAHHMNLALSVLMNDPSGMYINLDQGARSMETPIEDWL